ncbi:MAG: Jag N-terminal domain-containing protein [Erysipelotrichaceae bacterium]|nr:Jag N-terminal domain-containing protein [Erysipelotrichaceae bacterium]
MKTYTAKVLEDALNNAASDLNCQVSDLQYEVILEKKGLFSKKVEIKAYCLNTVINYVKQYIETVLNDMNLELVEVTMEYTNGRIRANVNTSNNPLLIGRSGIILRSFNMIVKAAVQNTFNKRYEIDVDINNYKLERYQKVEKMAKRFARSVQKSRIDMKLDPLPADERKVMHQVISHMNYVRTQSVGEGKNRCLTIIYDENKKVK